MHVMPSSPKANRLLVHVPLPAASPRSAHSGEYLPWLLSTELPGEHFPSSAIHRVHEFLTSIWIVRTPRVATHTPNSQMTPAKGRKDTKN